MPTTRPPHTPGLEPVVLTVDEAAELLRVDRKLVYSLIQRKKLPGVRRLGRKLRIERESLLRWLRAEHPQTRD